MTGPHGGGCSALCRNDVVGSARTALIGAVLFALLVVSSPSRAVEAASLDPVGSYDPGTPALNASAVGLDGVAYLGSWGSPLNCPGLGVRIIDVRDPANPSPLSVAAVYPRMTAEHLAVARFQTETFRGTVLLAGIQRCAASGPDEGGLALWDVSDPSEPRELGYLSVGRAVRGVHEFTLRQQGDRWLAYVAVPNSEVSTGVGELRIVDVTNPRQPVQLAEWGARKDGGLPIGFGSQCAPACRGSVAQAFLHSVAVSPDGRTAYLSSWDLGVLVVDVADPTAPTLVGRFAEPAAAEGNTHSVSLAQGGRIALVADETFDPPWGRLRLVDVQNAAEPRQVGTFETEHSAAGTAGGAQVWFGIHNPLTDDRNSSRAYLAWYADGVRLVDLTDPTAPFELASWVPPTAPQVWSVALAGDFVLVGDVNNGLYILTR